MKKLLLILLTLFIFGGCYSAGDISDTEAVQAVSVLEDDAAKNGFTFLKDAVPEKERDFTLMVYLNGSDLESKYACATRDLQEMYSSGFNSENLNVIVLTGGTSYWNNDTISSDTEIYKVTNKGIVKLVSLGKISVLNPELMTNFIDYCSKAFPAKKNGFVFWNHGGGTIHGYGMDQLYKDQSMSVPQIIKAFDNSVLKNKKLEFVGFDSCLMATIEIADSMQPYANYLIASEETEPGYGWDYGFLKTISENPNLTGAEIGKEIVTKYVAFYEDSSQDATLSTIDLSKMNELNANFEKFMNLAYDSIQNGDFNKIAKARKGTKSFGYSGENSGSYDIVDIKHLAQKMQSMYPEESKNLIKSIDETVVYKENNSIVSNSNGLSTYIPYLDKDIAEYSLQIYKSLKKYPQFNNFLNSYTKELLSKEAPDYSEEIAEIQPEVNDDSDISINLAPEMLDYINEINLTIWSKYEDDYYIMLGSSSNVDIAEDGKINTAFDGYWAELGGQRACFYEYENYDGTVKYSTPAVLNGEEVDIFAIFNEKYPDGKIIGALPVSESRVASKYMLPIEKGDKLQLQYYVQLFVENEEDLAKYDYASTWVDGDEFTVGDDFKIEIVPVDGQYLYGFWIEDVYADRYYTNFIEITY